MSDVSIPDVFDYMTYVNYRSNRDNDPSISPERWEKIYGPSVKSMEVRYQSELVGKLALINGAHFKQVSEVPTEKLDEIIAKIERIERKVVLSDDLMSVEEVAKRLGKHEVTIRSKYKSLIGYAKIKGEIYFKRSDFDAYINRHYIPSTETNNKQVAKRVARGST